MATKQRNNVNYFPHFVNHGKKMHYMRKKFGNDAYATWFIILEELGKADFHYLDLSDEIELTYLSEQCQISEELFIEIIETLVKFKEFDEQLWKENKVLFNQKFVDEISDAYRRRNSNSPDKELILRILNSKNNNETLCSHIDDIM